MHRTTGSYLVNPWLSRAHTARPANCWKHNHHSGWAPVQSFFLSKFSSSRYHYSLTLPCGLDWRSGDEQQGITVLVHVFIHPRTGEQLQRGKHSSLTTTSVFFKCPLFSAVHSFLSLQRRVYIMPMRRKPETASWCPQHYKPFLHTLMC